ncbi:hypothetical protein NBRC116588_04790 [Pyruvatibacter sp. HU-CL02332]|uniref:hypothetical protein n=1 Tax=Pyruvatibacter sp. HU-CL02332 TaxID=3127650 RepID=UPI003104CC5A
MSYAISVGFLILTALHAQPALSAVRPGMMASLYGPAVTESGLGILLHHRAMGFALVALSCLAAAFVPAIRQPVLILAGWSMVGFLVAYWVGGSPAGPIQRIALADLVCLPVLFFLAWAVWLRA